MRKKSFWILTAFVLIGCGESYDGELRGTLTLADRDRALVLRGHLGETRSFREGPVTIAYEDRGSFESSTFVIRQGRVGIALLVPKEEFASDRQFFFHGSRIGQSVDIEGRFDLTNVGDPFYRDVEEDCTRTAVCWHRECETHCHSVSDGRNGTRQECSTSCHDDWGLSSSCPGYKVVRLRGQDKRYVTRVRFLDSTNVGAGRRGSRVADFSHEHSVFTDEEPFRQLLGCVEDPSDWHNHFVRVNTSPRIMPESYRGTGRFSTPK